MMYEKNTLNFLKYFKLVFLPGALIVCFIFLRLSSGKEMSMKDPSKLSGTFIQYQHWMMQFDSKKWNDELDAIKKSDMDTLIIQWVKSDHERFYPVHVQGNDPTEIILKYSDKNDMKVFLGLQFDKNWWNNWDDKDFLLKTSRNCVNFGKKLFDRYGHHPSFSGWYIPYEMSDIDFDDEEIKNLNIFFKNVVANLKKLSTKRLPVALSVFFDGKLPPAVVEEIYTLILKKSGLDVLMIQDGVGSHGWNKQVRDQVYPYLAAYSTAARRNKIISWGIVESFSTIKDDHGNVTRVPAEISRIKEQLSLQSNQQTEKTLTFDFFHYMSPFRGEAQKRLYESYRKPNHSEAVNKSSASTPEMTRAKVDVQNKIIGLW